MCMHSPTDITLQTDIAYLSFKTPLGDINESHSRRVNNTVVHATINMTQSLVMQLKFPPKYKSA